MTTIELGSVLVDVVRKEIKHIHLVVYPPDGRVRLTAPKRYSIDTLRVFTIHKLGWIQNQRRKMQAQEREPPREMIERESHQVWGVRRLLRVEWTCTAPIVELRQRTIVLRVRPGTDTAKREAVLQAWYRNILREAVITLLPTWEKRLNVEVNHIFVQKMRTRWGSCNPVKGNIRLNTELAKKPLSCLEYVLVHEMIHLLEPRHGPAFHLLLDRNIPDWKNQRDLLNRLPVL